MTDDGVGTCVVDVDGRDVRNVPSSRRARRFKI